ncbi:Na+/H+ antiporter [Thermostichus vulcanus]|uniref:Na+/H+ antiporter n=1 Tax=Thermostichus vulcanus str. 'Rupite' TaxID=2813851 RepID=A0ABT0CBC5_THEVL|nr:Na+/H+ antiporter [Thermostichus vulcanus]MCJ2543041.1 Na+/H+ antiporter [Thermostichus vulcanus str. 'Rupite']
MLDGIPLAGFNLNCHFSPQVLATALATLAESEVLDALESEVIKANLERFLLVLTVSLSVATLPQVFRWVRQIPYTLLLVIVGAALALVDVRLVNLSPELILTIFLPPLLFEAAWNLKWRDLRRDLFPITLFAVVGVIISVMGIGLGLAQWAGIPLSLALLIGASLSATDPVSVIALFRELGVGERIKTLMEGESLFNDGVAVVAFGLLVGIPLGIETFDLQVTVLRVFTVVGIGVGMGALVGFGISYLTQRFDLPLVEQSLTLIAAYGTYLVVEELGGSGVIGVVTTGLILGNFGSRIGMNPRTRLIVSEFWEFLAFFVNSIVFLLIGDQIQYSILGENLIPIGVAITAMVISRALSTYGLSSFCNVTLLSNRGASGAEPISWKAQTVLWWGGLRGSVSIALALSVPESLPGREAIIATVFGVVLFTLLVQGLTVKPLLVGLDLLGDQPLKQEYMEKLARRAALQRVLEHLMQMDGRIEVEVDFYQYQKALVEGGIRDLEEEISALQSKHPLLKDYAAEQLREELLSIEADTYAEYVRSGQLNRELASFLQEVLRQSLS